jgi:hypothetical protein
MAHSTRESTSRAKSTAKALISMLQETSTSETLLTTNTREKEHSLSMMGANSSPHGLRTRNMERSCMLKRG